MKLNDYLNQRGAQAKLAHDIGVSPAFVHQWKTGVRPVPVEMCLAIERSTDGAVTRRDLRPDDCHLIWPDLATTQEPAHA